MLREVDATLQTKGGPFHRWFTDAEFDLHVWEDGSGRVVRGQLVYGKGGPLKAFEWKEGAPAAHFQVDDGEARGGRPKGSPLLIPEGVGDPIDVARRFERAAADLPPSLVRAVLEKLTA